MEETLAFSAMGLSMGFMYGVIFGFIANYLDI